MTNKNKHTVMCLPNMNMEARLIPNPETPFSLYDDLFGYGNGYVGVHKEHPLYGVHFNEYNDKGIHLSVHGGVTFTNHLKCNVSEEDENWLDEDYWWIGFDTRHSGDTREDEDYEYCLEQLFHLACQIATFNNKKL